MGTIYRMKALVVLSIAFLFSIIVFNNIADFCTNYAYVKMGLGMDAIANASVKWRAVYNSTAIMVFYWIIIIWEAIIAALCWLGGIQMLCFDIFYSGKCKNSKYSKRKSLCIIGLTAAFLLFVIAFASVGSEWFYMWQVGDTQTKAFLFAILSIASLTFVASQANEPVELRSV